jgi:hypothetical protein
LEALLLQIARCRDEAKALNLNTSRWFLEIAAAETAFANGGDLRLQPSRKMLH